MKKIFLILILVLSLSLTTFAEENKQSVQDIIRQSAVNIFSTSDAGIGFCSGVLIEDTKVLTAKHCIGTFEEVYIENQLVKSIIVSVDDDLALMILAKPITTKTKTKLAKQNPLIGDSVYHIGYPKLTEYYREGIINIKTSDHYYAFLDIIPGCSGGGVWNDNGELIGIAWGGVQMGGFLGSTLAIFEPIEDVYRFLETIK